MAAYPELAERIARHADVIARQAFDDLRGDPYAGAFMPAIGAMFAPERVAHDVAALVAALRSGDAPSMIAYVRELQGTAIAAGLTSRLLAQSFRRLHDAILESGLSEAGAARTMLDRAVLALRYDGRPAAAVQDASRQLAEDAVVTLRGVHLGEEAIEAEWIEALELVVSYLADAVALEQPQVLGAQMQRFARSSPSIAQPAEPAAMLAALEGALDELPDQARRAAAACLAAARTSLTAPAR